MAIIQITDVFNGISVPTETYTAQENGKFEKQLKQGVMEEGILCLITGSSKTGKTSLYGKVLGELDKTPIRVRCSNSLSAEDFWSYPLEHLDFSRLKTKENGNTVTSSGSGTVSGSLGWSWLAKLTGTVNVAISSARNDKEIQEAILAKPSPSHLIPLLKQSNAILVVEDFHYLSSDVQREIFQQWKIFTDNAISVIVVGTTHHGVDLAVANPDLIGRIKHIDLGRWTDNDLQSIATKGLRKLNVAHVSTISGLLAKESAGLPILMQQTCAQLFYNRDIFAWDTEKSITFTKIEAEKALHIVATERYSHFETWYTKLVSGPRKRARKYDTYQLILALFTQDPPTFNLHRNEIFSRLKSSGISPSEIPPPASINSTLFALDKFQERNNFELLEWSKKDSTVYILVPSFLFYLRWREQRTGAQVVDTFRLLLNLAGITHTAVATATLKMISNAIVTKEIK
jgi:hypothetical protein